VAENIYITSAEGHTGKSTIALGVLSLLSRTVERVGVFRPVARSTDGPDYVLELLLQHVQVDVSPEECIGVTYDDVHADADAALSRIVERFKAVEARCDAVVILGSDYTDVGTPTELGYNARIAANLGAPVLLVLGGRAGQGGDETLGKSSPRSAVDVAQVAEAALTELTAQHATVVGIIANRADPEQLDDIRSALEGAVHRVAGGAATPVWTLPEDRVLVAPSVRSVMEAVDGEIVMGDPALLEREALDVVIAGMSMENVLTRLVEGAVVVIPADRSETLLAVLMAHGSGTFPTIAGIILNGPFALAPPVQRLLDGLGSPVPIVRTPFGTYDTAVNVTRTRGRLAAESPGKVALAMALFEEYVDTDALRALLALPASTVVTPLMFEYGILDQAKQGQRHIVLPEGDDDRILRAAGTLLARHVARLTILGEERAVRQRATELGVDISGATVLSPSDPTLVERFAEVYTALRAPKGMTLELARDVVQDVSYFGTMMVHLGLADGMVSGATHTTAHTIRPSFEIIKTSPGTSIVSSVFLMALADRVLVYGDCAVNPDPTAEQLADIAISSAATAAKFGVEPRIAMLSYSTGESGSGADVEKVREATRLVRERRPDLLVEGPIQYDAAADAAVARTKMPDSQVAGRATVFIFPDLNTGNNTYKAVQRSAGAVAIGPVLQGLAAPVNDLSRGALVEDIVNTVAITAIQAADSIPAAAVPPSAAAGIRLSEGNR
jgi:phosphate acetyltransferase